MSKGIQPYIFIDENVSSVNAAQSRIDKACLKQKELKGELWGLVMATPRDITTKGEDPIDYLKERFEDLWDELWDAFIDEYKYTVVADDVQFNEESLVKKAWDEEEKSIQEMKEEQRKRSEFFDKFRGVLSPYNFDDHKIYEEFKAGNIIITEPLTTEQRAFHLREIEKRDKERFEEAFKRIEENDK